MKKGPLAHFRKLPIRFKVLLSILLVAIICLVIFTTIGSIYTGRILRSNTLYSAQKTLSQAEDNISFRIETLNQYIFYFAYSNEEVVRIFSMDPAQYPVSEQLIDQKTLLRMITQLRNRYASNIKDVRVYLNNEEFIYASSDETPIYPLSAISDSSWYQYMIENNLFTYYVPSEWSGLPDTISLVHLVSHQNDYSAVSGAIIIDIYQSNIREILEQCAVTPNSFSSLTNEEGVVISQTAAAQNNTAAPSTAAATQPIVYSETINSCRWTITLTIPAQDLDAISTDSIEFFSIIGLAILLLCVFLSEITAKAFTRRINMLNHFVRTYKHTNAVPLAADKNGDEIDQLIVGYNEMTAAISQLNEENAKKEKQLHKSELDMLQLQINPHFLFNTLDFIQHLAQTSACDHVASVVASFSSFYKQSLNHGSMLSTLMDELLHVKEYLNIQSVRFNKKLSLQVCVTEDLLDIVIPHITLQPLVENAIRHGFLDQFSDDHIIKITAERKAEDVYITVSDNGRGIAQHQLSTVFNSAGIGLKNCNDRIRLQFGYDYGIRIESVEDEYTAIIIHIPFIKKENAP